MALRAMQIAVQALLYLKIPLFFGAAKLAFF